jgi:hypothetical protein
VAALAADRERAALLVGRAEALRLETATELESAEQAIHDRTVAALRVEKSAAELREPCPRAPA